MEPQEPDFITPPKRKPVGIILAVLAILIVGGLALWFFVFRDQKDSSNSSSSTPVVKLKDPVVRPELIASGLKSPTVITSTPTPGDARLFVVEQGGTIRIINDANKPMDEPFLDISDKISSGGEMGLLGLAFHPDYKKNGFFYINYVDKDMNSTIARYHVSADANVADAGSAKVLFTLKQPYPNHNGGALAFGPDGYLYAAFGDGGSAGDPENRAQDKSNYFGKILRVDVNDGDAFKAPATNPFVHETGSKPEIWAYGLRNPWRISFDKTTGDLYIADVGQGELEEVNIQEAASKGGENYGWRCYEGKQPFKTDSCQDASKYTMPILEYDHKDGRCSVTGGYVYRGSRYPALTNKYFYGDFCSGQIFYASKKGKEWSNVPVATTPYAISTFGEGNDGELYFADFQTGSIYHLQDTANKN